MSGTDQASIRYLLLRTPMHTRPLLYNQVTGDSADGCPVVCGAPGCGKVIALRDSHSVYVGHRYTRGLDPVECDDASADSGQHFGCSIEHAYAATLHCLQNHIRPKHEAMIRERDRIEAERAQAAEGAAHQTAQ